MELQIKADRALSTEGQSGEAIYLTVAKLIGSRTGKVVDVGCGQGIFSSFLYLSKYQYIGADIIRYPEFSQDCEFIEADLDTC